jgi:hypothetical protein
MVKSTTRGVAAPFAIVSPPGDAIDHAESHFFGRDSNVGGLRGAGGKDKHEKCCAAARMGKTSFGISEGIT